ncbi:MAG: lactate utilization protein [Desulfobulbaceae bacterium]|nr:lactate utilization protein [Desulfobulbaceae bacterium]
MKNPIDNYWQLRLQELKLKLDANNFEAFIASDLAEAEELIVEKLVPAANPQTVSYGGSMTLKEMGALDRIEGMEGVELLRPDVPGLSGKDKIERKRQGLLVDLYLTGTNAVTEDGQLVNLDMIGNRVAAITFGPKKVIIVVGRNKIVADLEMAMHRIKDYAAPANTMRLDMKTPCVKTSTCVECSSPGRICNYWTITEKAFPKSRIAVILINEDLGL